MFTLRLKLKLLATLRLKAFNVNFKRPVKEPNATVSSIAGRSTDASPYLLGTCRDLRGAFLPASPSSPSFSLNSAGSQEFVGEEQESLKFASSPPSRWRRLRPREANKLRLPATIEGEGGRVVVVPVDCNKEWVVGGVGKLEVLAGRSVLGV